MRENCTYGSEGGETRVFPTPINKRHRCIAVVGAPTSVAIWRSKGKSGRKRPSHKKTKMWERCLRRDLAIEGTIGTQAPLPVRSQRHTHSLVEVRTRVSQDPVVEGNCVVVRRGGEQPETNWRSAG